MSPESHAWSVEWRESALRNIQRLDRSTRMRILGAVDRLAATEYGDVTYLTTPQRGARYRLRVGPWRVLFNRDETARTLTILHVLPRGSAYQN